MKVHYHEMWNHTTSSIDVPEDYQNPFNILVVDENGNKRRPLTSLEILHSVLHGMKYKAEFEAVEAYMESNANAKGKNKTNTKSQSVPVPKCLLPDVGATQHLANNVVKARRERSQQKTQQIRNETWYNNKLKEYWPFVELMLPLPILNGKDFYMYPTVNGNCLPSFDCVYNNYYTVRFKTILTAAVFLA